MTLWECKYYNYIKKTTKSNATIFKILIIGLMGGLWCGVLMAFLPFHKMELSKRYRLVTNTNSNTSVKIGFAKSLANGKKIAIIGRFPSLL